MNDRALRGTIVLALLFLAFEPAPGRTLTVGSPEYPTLERAAAVAEPGDTIELLSGEHRGGISISGLAGREKAPIVIRSSESDPAEIVGGNTNMQLSDCSWLRIERIRFRDALLNGVNIDDGGSYETPTHHIEFVDCDFTEIRGTGNNDLLKLSGLDSFSIVGCRFSAGSSGGSGIDMVGCHFGVIAENTFEDMGTSSTIQAKGGTQYLRIERNTFRNGGARTLNLGGSTGLAFFRPIDAPFEAADIDVCANIFVGSDAPIAYVGSVRMRVVNNTFWKPERWVFRILQETVDPERFVEVGDNIFANNIVVVDSRLSRTVNIGPNTRPSSFLISHNLWYSTDDDSWRPTDLPVEDRNGVFGRDPMFMDTLDFSIDPDSPAVAAADGSLTCEYDHFGIPFLSKSSIGAREIAAITSVRAHVPNALLDLY